MPPTPHDDLHPTARDHAQKEGREESHCDLRVKHRDWPRKTLSYDLGLAVFRSAISCAAKILLRLNLKIPNAAIYSTLVVRDVVMAEL
jgi:hypothetical protein